MASDPTILEAEFARWWQEWQKSTCLKDDPPTIWGESAKGPARLAFLAGRESERQACEQACRAEADRVDALIDAVVPEGNLYLAGKAAGATRCARLMAARKA